MLLILLVVGLFNDNDNNHRTNNTTENKSEYCLMYLIVSPNIGGGGHTKPKQILHV